jgi:hypothetical protein
MQAALTHRYNDTNPLPPHAHLCSFTFQVMTMVSGKEVLPNRKKTSMSEFSFNLEFQFDFPDGS